MDILLLLCLFRTVQIYAKYFQMLPEKPSFQKTFAYLRNKKFKVLAFEKEFPTCLQESSSTLRPIPTVSSPLNDSMWSAPRAEPPILNFAVPPSI